MKKSLRKPENWQDFEMLCKKLFGEMWDCRNTIKKNGRTGQAQSGVDVYGVPKKEDGYYGVQCKGKDDYTQAQLTQSEIATEIGKARTFDPPLKVFVIATTANKDAQIETFVRLEDLKSRKAGGFEIVYYAWEDLADLIEDNRETFQWYVAGQQFRDKHEVELLVNGQPETTIQPQYIRHVKMFRLREDMVDLTNTGLGAIMAFNKKFEQAGLLMPTTYFKPQQYNYTWCPLELTVNNTGGRVLEDWKIELQIDGTKIKGLTDKYDGEEPTNPMVLSALSISAIHARTRTVFTDSATSTVIYKPISNILIQKDYKRFTIWIQPVSHDVGEIDLNWHLLARDFDASGKLKVKVEPKLERSIREVEVEDKSGLKEKEITIAEKITDKE